MKTKTIVVIAVALLSSIAVCVAQTNPVSGSLTTDTWWTNVGTTYELAGDLTVNAGVKLTVSPGVIVQTKSSSYDFFVRGVLEANGVWFRGVYDQLDVRTNGQAYLTNCIFSGSSSKLTYDNGSRGVLNNVRGTNGWDVTLDCTNVVMLGGVVSTLTFNASATVSNCVINSIAFNAGTPLVTGCTINAITLDAGAPVVTGCTITNAIPLIITDPDGQTSGFSGNTFTAPGAKIRIYGTLNGTRVLGALDGLSHYVFHISSDLLVLSGAQLIVQPGVELEDNYSSSFPKLRVSGLFIANGVLFSGTYNDPTIRSSGQAYVTNCVFNGPSASFTFEANSSGVLNNVQGTNGWDVTLSSSNVVVTGCVLNELTLEASAQVTSCTLNSISLSGGTPVVTGCTITNALPVVITDPDGQTSGFSGNTFTAPGAKIRIYGTLNGTRVLGSLDGLSHYLFHISSDLLVLAGAQLIVQPGVELEDNYSSSFPKLRVSGLFIANGVLFSGTYNDPTIRSGGQAYVTNCVFNGPSASFTFEAGSSGVLNNVQGTNGWDVTLSSSNVVVTGCVLDHLTLEASAQVTSCTLNSISLSGGTPMVTGCTITNALPVLITDPDGQTSGFSGNTFTAPGAKIRIYGTLNGTRVLGALDGLSHYLFHISSDLLVLSGAQLIVQPGVELEDNYSSSFPKLRVSGLFIANGVLFSGTDNDPSVGSGGRAYLTNCVFTGSGSITYQSGSTGVLSFLSGNLQRLTLEGGASVLALLNDFSQTTVTTSGSSGTIFDLRYNYWGTTNAALIETRITHRADNPSLPLVRYSRCLHASPLTAMVQAWLGDDEVQPCWFRGNITLQAGVTAAVPVIAYSGFDAADVSFDLSYPPDRLTGFGLVNWAPQIAWASIRSNSPISRTVRLGTGAGQSIRGLGRLGDLTVAAAYNQLTAFAPLDMPGIVATNAPQTYATNGPGEGVPLLFLGSQPLLDATVQTNRQRTLTLYGNPGTNYTIQFATNLSAGGPWQTATQHLVLPDQCLPMNVGISPTRIFYRAFRE